MNDGRAPTGLLLGVLCGLGLGAAVSVWVQQHPVPQMQSAVLGGDDDDLQRQHIAGRNFNESPILEYQPRERRAQTLPLGANPSRRDCSSTRG